jgi:hypothetical protein
VRVRIDKSGQNNFPASIDNFDVASVTLDFAAGPDEFDSAVAN